MWKTEKNAKANKSVTMWIKLITTSAICTILLLYDEVIILQESGKKDFEVGDEVDVLLSSFSTKGIPIFSLVD